VVLFPLGLGCRPAAFDRLAVQVGDVVVLVVLLARKER